MYVYYITQKTQMEKKTTHIKQPLIIQTSKRTKKNDIKQQHALGAYQIKHH